MKLFDERYKRTTGPTARAYGARRSGSSPHVARREHRLDDRGRHEPVLGRALRQELGLDELWVKLCGDLAHRVVQGPGHDRAGVVVKQMIADGKPIRAVACASTGDTSAALAAYGAAAGIRAVVILPRGKISTAQLVQPLANGALVLALDTDFDGCMAIVQRLAKEEGVYLANWMNSLRLEGQKTVAIEIVQQFDWEVPDWVDHPGRQPRQRQRARRRLRHDAGAGRHPELPASAWRRPQAANPLYRAYKDGWDKFAADPGQADAGLGHPDRQPGQRAEGDPGAEEVRRRRRAGLARTSWPRPPPAPTARACSPARTPAWRWPPSRSWWRAARSGRGDRVVVMSHRQRPEVHRLQGPLPRGRAARRAEPQVRQPARAAAQRLRRRPRHRAQVPGLRAGRGRWR